MTHLYHNNKSAGEWLSDIATNTQGISKGDNDNFNNGDQGMLGLAIKENNYYKLKQKLVPSLDVKNFARGSPGSDPDIEGAKSPISISDNYAIIGADNKAFIYKFSSTTNVWSEIQILEPLNENEASSIAYGESVSISGIYCIVSARLSNNIGAVYLYKLSSATNLFEFNSKLVPQELININTLENQRESDDLNKVSNFGASIDIDGDTIVIGAPEWENQRSNNSIGGNWTYNGTTKVWTLSNNHNLTSTGQLRNRALYFYQVGTGATGYEINTVYRIKSLPDVNTMQLGDLDNNLINSTVNSSGTWKAAKMDWNRGAVFVYTLQNNTWTQTQKLRPDFANPITSDSEEFGQCVRIYKNVIAVQSDGSGNSHDLIGTRPERVFIFNKIGNSWEQVVNNNFMHLSYNALTKPPSSDNTNPFFGVNLSIYEDTLVLPAKRLTVQTNDQSATTGKRQGIVFIYRLNKENIFSLSQRIIDDNSKDTDLFGTDTSIYKDKLAISSSVKNRDTNIPGKGVGGSNKDINFPGKIFIYKNSNNKFILCQEITSLPEISSDYLNFITVNLYKNLLFIGADGDRTITITNGGQYYNIYETFDILAAEDLTQTQNNVSVSIGDKIGEGSVKYATGGVVSEIYIIRLTPSSKQYYEGTFTTNNSSESGENLAGILNRNGAVYVYEINKTYNHLNMDNGGGLITSGSIQNNTPFLDDDTGNLPMVVRNDYITPKQQNDNTKMPLVSNTMGALYTSNLMDLENTTQYKLVNKLVAFDALDYEYQRLEQRKLQPT